MVRVFLLSLLAVSFLSVGAVGGNPRNKTVTFEELRKFVQDSLKRDGTGVLEIDPLRFSMDDARYYLDGPRVYFEMKLPWAGPIKHLTEIAIARRARSLPIPDREWQAYLNGLENWVAKETAWIREHLRDQRRVSAEKLEEALKSYHAFIEKSLRQPIVQAAKAKGLDFGGFRPPRMGVRYRSIPKGADRFFVKVSSDPPNASIHYLPEFEYRFKERFGQLQDATNWREVADNRVRLSGNYRFLVRWPSRAKTTGTIEIVRDTSLVLRP